MTSFSCPGTHILLMPKVVKIELHLRDLVNLLINKVTSTLTTLLCQELLAPKIIVGGIINSRESQWLAY